MPVAHAADGATLYYEVHDYTDPWRKAPAIVMVHGFGRSGKFWFNVIPYLARFFRVICPDLRGMGQSVPLPDPLLRMTVDRLVADIGEVADHAGLDRFHLVGESIGGGFALLFAAAHSDRLKSLCVIAPGVYVNEWVRKEYAVGFPSWEEAIRTLGVEGWGRKSNTVARFPADADPAFLAWYSAEVGKTDVESLAALTRAAGSVDARPVLDRIQAPVLALFPSSSQIVTHDMRDLFLQRIPRVQVKNIATPYQMLQLLKPAECGQEILGFAALHEGIVARE